MRAFTTEQKALLRAQSLRVRVLMTFFLDEGTFRFCDDAVSTTSGADTYIGAGALASKLEIRSGRDLAAEPITLTLDGNRMVQAGIADPAKVLREILAYLHHQRRVDIALGFSYPEEQNMNLIVPMAALKINNARLIDEDMSFESPDQPVVARLEIVMDSLAARYSRAPFRTRSHEDQLEIDPTDLFYSFTVDSQNTEKTLYWGKKSSVAGGVSSNGVTRYSSFRKLMDGYDG